MPDPPNRGPNTVRRGIRQLGQVGRTVLAIRVAQNVIHIKKDQIEIGHGKSFLKMRLSFDAVSCTRSNQVHNDATPPERLAFAYESS